MEVFDGPFTWVPGQGADPEALARIRAAFPRPAEAMGEAWFMGNRRRFPELMGPLDGLTNTELSHALDEIVRGPRYFGLQADEEWRDWHHYLLVERYPRIHEHYPLVEVFVSGLFAIYPNGITDAGLRRDLLLTVGRSLMEPECWPEGRLDSRRCLGCDPEECWDCNFKFSAAAFFCLKHLQQAEVGPWMQSIVEIADPLWRAQLIAFAAEAHPVLADAAGADEHFKGQSGLYWDGTEVLAASGGFRGWWPSRENRTEVIRALRSVMTRETLADWGREIEMTHPEVWEGLREAAGRCPGLYAA